MPLLDDVAHSVVVDLDIEKEVEELYGTIAILTQ